MGVGGADPQPADEQLAVNLFYMEGYRISEIAAMCGVPENTVKSRLKRAPNKRDKPRTIKGEQYGFQMDERAEAIQHYR